MAALLFTALPAYRLTAQCPDGTPPPCARAARPAPVPRGSVAVLPFANRSADSADAYLAEELPEQISGRLSRVSGLRVTSATAVAAQWRRTPDALAAARALRVEWLVTGSLRRVGTQLSASIELVQSASGEQAWSSVLRRADGDVGAIETIVAESVAVAVVGRLAPAQLALIHRTATRNPDAYRLYLQARSLMARRTTAEIAAAASAVTTATRLDPGFAAAWARLSMARSLQTQYGSPEGTPRADLLVASGDAASRALALDSNLAEAWLAVAQLKTIAYELGEAHRALERAARLDSLNAEIEHAFGYLYSADMLLQPEEAERHFRRAVALNPDLRNSWRHLGLSFEIRGRMADALAFADSSLSRGWWTVGLLDRAWIRFEMGDPAGARLDQARADSMGATPRSVTTPIPPPARLALYAAAAGDSTVAFGLLSSPPDSAGGAVARAVVAMGFGRRDQALSLLEGLRGMSDPTEPTCAVNVTCSANMRTYRTLMQPIFRPLHGDPRYQRLLAETRPRIPWLPGGSSR